MRHPPPSINRFASFDAATLLDLCRAAHHRYARCLDEVAPRFAASIVDLELELLRRNIPIDAPPEPDVPLANLPAALRRATALQRIRSAVRNGDLERFNASVLYLSPDDLPEAWDRAYAFRGDLPSLGRALQMIFLTAYAQRDGFDAAWDAFEELIESGHSLTSSLTTLERALCDLLQVAAPFDALISSFGRWREGTR